MSEEKLQEEALQEAASKDGISSEAAQEELLLKKETKGMQNQKKVSIFAGIFFLVIVILHFCVSKFANIGFLVSANEAKEYLASGNPGAFTKWIADLVVAHPGLGFVNNILLSQGMLLIPVLIFLIIVCGKKWIRPTEVLHLKKMHWATWLLVPVTCALLEPSLMLINAMSQLFVKNQIGGVLIGSMTNLPYLIGLALIALTPALVEEMTCRGMVLGSLYDDHDPLPAIFISGITFGLMHMNINQFLYASVLGILMACLLFCSGSIFSTSLLHFLFNGFSVTLMYLLAKGLPAIMRLLGQNTGDSQGMADILMQQSSNGVDATNLLMLVCVMAVPAILGLALAFGVMYLIARLNHRDHLIMELFQKRTPEERAARRAERKLKGRYVTIPLLISWIAAGIICVYSEFH